MEKDNVKDQEKTGPSMLDMLKESPEYEQPKARESKDENSDSDNQDFFSGFDLEQASDNDDFLGAPPPPPEESPARPEPGKVNQANAKMAVNIIDMVSSKVAGAVAGTDSSKYKMSKEDREDYVTITADYFATLQTNVSPALMWWATTVTIIGATLYQAQEEKKAAQQLAAHRKAKARYQALQANAEASADQLAQTYNEMKQAEPDKPKRKRFEIDADGLFEYSDTGVYLKKKEREEHPAPQVRQIIAEGEEMKMSQGEINRMCREFLYGESN